MPWRLSSSILLILLALGSYPLAQSRTLSQEPPSADPLIVELKRLRLEVIEQRLDGREEYIRRLEYELAQLRTDEQKMQRQEAQRAQALEQANRQLAQAELSEEERQELEAGRAALFKGGQDTARSDLDRWRTELTQAIEQARREQQLLLKRAAQLRADLGEARKAHEQDTSSPRPRSR